MVDAHLELREAERGDRRVGERDALGVGHPRGGAHDVGVALVKLAEAALLRSVCAPHGLDLVALERERQRAVHRDDPGQRHGEVVAERHVRLALAPALAALEDAEDELLALVAVLAHQRFDALDGGRLERLEAVPREELADDADDVEAAVHRLGEQIAGAAGGLDGHGSSE